MSGSWHYINGTWHTHTEAHLPVEDLGLMRGYGVFDFLRIYEGVPFHLDDHLRRIVEAAERLKLPCPYSINDLEEIVMHVIARNEMSAGGVRLILTGGISADQLTPSGTPTLIAMATPLHRPSDEQYREGISAVTTSIERFLPNVKTTHYVPAILAMEQAKKAGASEALYLNRQGGILEATRSNFFAVKEGRLITDDSDQIVRGVTRKVILEIAGRQMPIERRALHLDELGECTEAFICSSGKEVLGLTAIDGQKVGNGSVGSITQSLAEQFKDYVRAYCLKNERAMSISS